MRTLFQLTRVEYLLYIYLKQKHEFDQAVVSVTIAEGLEVMTPFDWVELITDMMTKFRCMKWISRAIKSARLSDAVVYEMWQIVLALYKPQAINWITWNNVLYNEILIRPASFLKSIKTIVSPYRIYHSVVPRVLFECKNYELLMECINQSSPIYQPLRAVSGLVHRILDPEVRMFWQQHFPPKHKLQEEWCMYSNLLETNINALYGKVVKRI